jgi:hypothetical protein
LVNRSDLVSAPTTGLDSFWLQQLFFDNKLRIRAGQLARLDFYGKLGIWRFVVGRADGISLRQFSQFHL